MSAPAKPTNAAPAAKPSDAKSKAPKRAKIDRSGESKSARFQRIAKVRVGKAIAAIRRLETVGRSPTYEYTPEQAAKVMKYLEESVDKVRMAFVARVNDRPEESVTL